MNQQTTKMKQTIRRPRTERKREDRLLKGQSQKGLGYYLELKYPIELIEDEDAYVASHPDLPGCVSFGDSPDAAVSNLGEVRKLWIEGQLESGVAVPEPLGEGSYSGKFVLRIAKQLHRLADFRARQEGASLNSYVGSVLAGALQYPSGPKVYNVSLAQEADHLLHSWGTPLFQTAWNIQERTPRSGPLFMNFLAKQIGNSSLTPFNPLQAEDYINAEESYHASSR